VLALVAEAAADVGRDQANAAFGYTELLGDIAADVMRHLRRAVERELVARSVRHCQHRARLDGAADEAVVDEIKPRHMRRLLRRLADRGFVAARPAKADIARRGFMQLLRPRRGGGAGIDRRRQQRIVDIEQLGGIERLLARLANNDRNRLANMTHALARQRPAWRLCHRRAVGASDRPQRAHRADMIASHVGAAENRDHAGRRR
jgi:hypothetical protein